MLINIYRGNVTKLYIYLFMCEVSINLMYHLQREELRLSEVVSRFVALHFWRLLFNCIVIQQQFIVCLIHFDVYTRTICSNLVEHT